MSYFKVKNISKKYKEHLALDKVSFSIEKGSVFGLLGHNGAGKSTLIRIILNIISSTAGDILLHNKTLNRNQIRNFGYLPEERGLYKGMKVQEQLLYFARLHGMPTTAAKENIRFWLERFELTTWQNTLVSDLSKGMQQKIQFINAIVHHPEFLILDEPFSGFDPVNSQLFIAVIKELKAKGTTILFSSHQMQAVEDLCDELLILNKGKVVLQGSLEQLKAQYRTANYVVTTTKPLRQDTAFEVTSTTNDQATITLNQPLTAVIDLLNQHYGLQAIVKEEPSLTDIFIKSFKLV